MKKLEKLVVFIAIEVVNGRFVAKNGRFVFVLLEKPAKLAKKVLFCLHYFFVSEKIG